MLGKGTEPSAFRAAALARTEAKVVAHLPSIAKTLRIDQLG